MINNLQNSLIGLNKGKIGLHIASHGPWYQKYWIRDNHYIAWAYLQSDPEHYAEIYHSILDFFQKSERDHNKCYWLQKEPYNKAGYRRYHPRCTETLDEINEEWGFKQNDNLGEVLFGVYIGETNGIKILRGPEDYITIYKIIQVMEAIEYWHDPDHGIWEEGPEEIRASSIGACVAGLKAIRKLGFEVKQELIDNGEKALSDLIPFETTTRKYDMTLLSLIWPFQVVTDEQALLILHNLEDNLVRPRGLIRYPNDVYYGNENGEMQWCFGFAFMALSWYTLGNIKKAKFYKDLLLNNCIIEGYNVPEGFYAGTDIPNDNFDLGWSIAMTILVLEKIK